MNSHEVCSSVKDKVYWEDIRDDPVFRDIPEDCELIAVDHILGNRDYLDVGAQDEDFDEEDGELSQRYQHTGDQSWGKHEGDGWVEAREHDFGPDHQSLGAAQNQETPVVLGGAEINQSHEMQETTEERLARLGVTGDPKPVRAPARPYVQDSLPRLPQESATHFTDQSRNSNPHSQ